jgi:signal transduction histidine kinase
VEDDGEPKPLHDDVRALLFRAVQELLMNVVKHARAGNVTVFLEREDDMARVSVEDDGVGFDPSVSSRTEEARGGFGLFSIRERLDYLGGQFDIQSAPGRGTLVTLCAPLAREDTTNEGDEA